MLDWFKISGLSIKYKHTQILLKCQTIHKGILTARAPEGDQFSKSACAHFLVSTVE